MTHNWVNCFLFFSVSLTPKCGNSQFKGIEFLYHSCKTFLSKALSIEEYEEAT